MSVSVHGAVSHVRLCFRAVCWWFALLVDSSNLCCIKPAVTIVYTPGGVVCVLLLSADPVAAGTAKVGVHFDSFPVRLPRSAAVVPVAGGRRRDGRALPGPRGGPCARRGAAPAQTGTLLLLGPLILLFGVRSRSQPESHCCAAVRTACVSLL